MQCSSIEEIREKIDSIDERTIRLIAERAEYVRQAAAFKKDENGVKAPDRVKDVLEKVRKKALEYGAPADIAENVYRNMIAGFINMELESFDKNK